MAAVDDIVEKLPPPGKMPAAGADDTTEGGDAEYNAEDDSAMQVASALGADPKTVDVKALAAALKEFIRIAGE